MGHLRPLFLLFPCLLKQCYNKKMWKMSVQYLALGFELTTSSLRVFCLNHYIDRGFRPNVSVKVTRCSVSWWSRGSHETRSVQRRRWSIHIPASYPWSTGWSRTSGQRRWAAAIGTCCTRLTTTTTIKSGLLLDCLVDSAYSLEHCFYLRPCLG